MTQVLTRRRSSLAVGAAVGLVGLVVLAAIVPRLDRDPVAPVLTCDRSATSAAALTREYAAASAGQTICLGAGDYGTLRGGRKAGLVTIQPAHGVRASIGLDLDSTVNLRVERMVVTTADIRGASRDITVTRSRFTGQAVIHADQMADAHILLDRNTHANIDACATCFAGRVHVTGDSGHPSGVVVSRSLFSGGASDGVRADANGVVIASNEFRGLSGAGDSHTDPIQIYGGTHVVIRGNYFHDNAVAAQIMMANGGDHNVVENNVIAGAGYTWAMTWNTDDGSLIRHNTFADGACDAGVRCGTISLAGAAKPGARPTVIRDNVITAIGSDGLGAGFVADHNLTALPTPGKANLTGAPRYAGPRTTYRGHRLAKGSLGTRDASDGADRGIR